jgi:hypothetical protein
MHEQLKYNLSFSIKSKQSYFLKKTVFSSIEKCTMQKKKFFVTSNLRYMHGVLNVDKIKN